MKAIETPQPRPKTKPKLRGRTRTKSKAGDGMPDMITVEQLRSPVALLALYRQYRGQILEHDFFALACRALRKGTNPPAVFRWMLANGKAHQITLDEDSEARKMLKTARGERCDWLRNVVNGCIKSVPKPERNTPWQIQQALTRMEEGEG